ncbi:dynein regulatory complex subunit 6 isoform X1 [Oreochromis niloticus]|uniref:dynein regulatory complex subunit 6 isoform X1 n=1 Tax=Oreochromis niloticus TaxID=8128 RepID=UPI0009048AB0|nr:dynein regulatory complex subunit 6 isoform X1 [Oreochromis niloticus]XP_019217054.1 dynein regulatory complex subunit 6 isoform X1 [Oreochromis niloticus]XP_025765250.1 dynein regulatory complex subunit 6 isoform X1 [Oreochromis niloticus]
MDLTKKHFERKCWQVALTKLLSWVKLHKRMKAVGFTEMDNKHQQSEKGCDALSVLPNSLLLKIFQYLELQELLNCAEVCCTWKSIIQSGVLWSQINLSVAKDWITDGTVKKILQSYRLFVTHLNLRGCTSLQWPSLRFVSYCFIAGECRNLQELNVSECLNVTDMMVQRILEGCPYLLYLNLSCTLLTNKTLQQLSRNCLSLQYLSLAYCDRFTDEGFLYLTTGKGCHSLIHLNLSGCTQLTVNGFRYISAGCPALEEIVVNDMLTLSDSCVLALLTRCHCLSAISLLDAPHLSDITFKAVAEAANLKSLSIEGNYQLTDFSWNALCRSSQGLRRLHAAECPRMTDASLKSVASLQHLRYLNISYCNRVTDVGVQYLTKGCSANELQELNISHCSHITDISVMRIAQRLCKLHHLNLSYCERLTDLAVEWLGWTSLCSLDLSGCNIQDEGLATLEGIPLRKLVIAKCFSVTDAGIKKLCKNVTDLEHVDISHCVALSDAAVRAFSFYCRGLVALRMVGCFKMTDMAVQYLTSGSQYLRELDVSGCVLLTDLTLRYLERICPPLSSITMVCCSRISRAAASKLQPRVTYWEHSSDTPPYWFGYNMGHPVTKPTK